MNDEAVQEQRLAELEDGDVVPVVDDLLALACFQEMKKAPNLNRFSKDFVLRKGTPGRVICEQGEAGTSAYYVLTKEDVLDLRKRQLEKTEKALEGLIASMAAEEPTPAGEDAELQETAVKKKQSEEKKQQKKIELEERVRFLKAEIAETEQQIAFDKEKEEAKESAVLSVFIDLPQPRTKKKRGGLIAKLGSWLNYKPIAPPVEQGEFNIPIDAPAVLTTKKPVDVLREGDLFGEMSCMYRTPRSATVKVDEPCYMLEMLRSVLDTLYKDPSVKERLDQQYRDRVLKSHLKYLAFFQGIDADEEAMKKLAEMATLVQLEAGDVVFEEFDESDAIYIIRQGMVKVIANAGCQILPQHVTGVQWDLLAKELVAGTGRNDELSRVTYAELKKHLSALTVPTESETTEEQLAVQPKSLPVATEEDRATVLEGLNNFILQGEAHTKLGDTKEEVLEYPSFYPMRRVFHSFPKRTKNWSELERRVFHRLLLEICCPHGMPKRAEISGAMKTFTYLNQGDVLGEIGVVMNQPRSATCVAYDHPDGEYGMDLPTSRATGISSKLELVRIDRKDFQQFLGLFPQLKAKLDAIIEERLKNSKRLISEPGTVQADSYFTPEIEELGIIQGQNLLLVDLDSCTRCGACMEACITAHDDNRSRIYLDGPRYDNYLIPISCRKCQDPVCLIGCPVGSINRGDDLEIVIRDWCTGCSFCANQCPYGSIQIMERNEGEDSQLDVSVKPKAVVCDMCKSTDLGTEACVYACPHDAARRTNAALEFPFR